MAVLFKLWITRYVDASGRRVDKSTPGSHAVRERSRKWYGEYQDADGIARRVPLATDKAAAQAKLSEIIKRVERKQAGLHDSYEEHERRPLIEHLEDYRVYLRSKGNTNKHAAQTISRIKGLLEGCAFHRLRDLDALKVATWLAAQRQTSKRFSAQTSNFYGDVARAFCAWLVTNDRIARNPLALLRRVNIAVDRRHDRRALSEDEFRKLIESAASGPMLEGLSGRDRAMLYVLATWTGLRRGELAALTRRCLELDTQPPTIRLPARLPAKASKRRKAEQLPLHPAVVEELRAWPPRQAEARPDTPLFILTTSKGQFRKTSKMMKLDLERAGMSYRDEDGLFADFHANRHTFISNLSWAGVPLVTAQKLTRHSAPKLTATRYTHLGLDVEAGAIGSLPAVPSVNPPESVDRSRAPLVAVTPVAERLTPSSDGTDAVVGVTDGPKHKPLPEQGFGEICQPEIPTDSIHPKGFEPLTVGSEDRCSIQLSYGCMAAICDWDAVRHPDRCVREA